MRKDERSDQILAGAAKVFYEKGYDRAGVRDVARESKMSLAGLYYHFRSKEGPVARLEAFIHSHLSCFIANLTERKVLSHDYHRLAGEEYRELARLRREPTRSRGTLWPGSGRRTTHRSGSACSASSAC